MSTLAQSTARRGLKLHLLGRFSRPISSSPRSRVASKDAPERDEMYIDAQEYSKSSYDGVAASNQHTAFGKETDPQEQHEQARNESAKVSRSNTFRLHSLGRVELTNGFLAWTNI